MSGRSKRPDVWHNLHRAWRGLRPQPNQPIKSRSRRPVAKVLLNRAERRCCVSAQRASSSNSPAQRAREIATKPSSRPNGSAVHLQWAQNGRPVGLENQRLLNRVGRTKAAASAGTAQTRVSRLDTSSVALVFNRRSPFRQFPGLLGPAYPGPESGLAPNGCSCNPASRRTRHTSLA